MVLYLKYRPQKLSELAGQAMVVQSLKSAYESGKLSHAYLFCGPRGVGKTSTARILAKMVNCEKGGDDDCETCKSITDGSCLDLIEIDAASNRGIDDVRDLREKIKLSPSSLKKKVYIIDEVHMLTNEAFNALLKTLEEPPAHVLFILATTEVHKIPQTILSRVTRLDFKGAETEGLLTTLRRVAQGEEIDINDDALKVLAKKSDGSYRDAVKLLDQLASLNQKITVELVEDSLRGGKFESILNLAQTLAKKDAAAALKLISLESTSGTNLKEYLFSIMDIFRSMLLIKQGVMDLVKNSYSEEQFTSLLEISKNFSNPNLIRILTIFQEAYEKLKVTSIPTLPLEIAVVESCQTAAKEEVVVQTVQTVLAKEQPVTKKQDSEIVIPADAGIQKSMDPRVKPEDDNRRSGMTNESDEDKHSVPSNELVILQDKWSYILEVIRQSNTALEALLRSVEIGDIDSERIIFKVPYSFHQRILETPRNRDLLEYVLADILGKPIKVGCVLEQRPIRVEELANVEVAADDEVIRLAAEIFSSDGA